MILDAPAVSRQRRRSALLCALLEQQSSFSETPRNTEVSSFRMMKKSCTSGFPRMSLLSQPCCQSRVSTSRWLCRCMNVPNERGDHDIKRLTERDSGAFLKFQPQASPPSPRAPLAPLRDDVPLTDPCSGRLSAAARADLGLSHTDTFTHTVCTAPSDLRTARHQPHTPSLRPDTPTVLAVRLITGLF